MKHQDNGMKGMMRAVEVEIGGHLLTIKVMNIESSRKVWAKLQRLILALVIQRAAVEESAPELRFDEAALLAAIEGKGGLVDEELMKALSDSFAPFSTFQIDVDNGDGRTRTDIGRLSEPGKLDVVFGGDISAYLEWMDVNIQLNFHRQIEKMQGVLELAAKRAEEAKTPKAEPTPAGA